MERFNAVCPMCDNPICVDLSKEAVNCPECREPIYVPRAEKIFIDRVSSGRAPVYAEDKEGSPEELIAVKSDSEKKIRLNKTTVIVTAVTGMVLAIAITFVLILNAFTNSARSPSVVAEIGGYITCGLYEQNGSHTDGKEKIEWLVLDISDGKALVVSKYALDVKPYNVIEGDVSWETSSVRAWLNNGFLADSFTDAERERILPTVTDVVYSTVDSVFLLSVTEAIQYFRSDDERRCTPTDYAVKNGVSTLNNGEDVCRWWLRSPGMSYAEAAVVFHDGDVLEDGDNVSYGVYGIRPAMWISIE